MFLLLVVMLDRPCSNVQCKAAGYPLHSHVSPSLPLPSSPRAIRFRTRYSKVSAQVRRFTVRPFRNTISFNVAELSTPRHNPKREDHPLSAVRDCLFQFIRSYPPYRRPFLHPQPENAPCRGDRDPLMTTLRQHYFHKCSSSVTLANNDTSVTYRLPTPHTQRCTSNCTSTPERFPFAVPRHIISKLAAEK